MEQAPSLQWRSDKRQFVGLRRKADMQKSPAVWRDFSLCWHYLSSRQVALQVLSARMSLTSVFGMGTGGPSSQSIPTSLDGLLPIIYVKTLVQVLTVFVFSSFLPKLKAQRSGFQFEATNQHTGEETRLRVLNIVCCARSW